MNYREEHRLQVNQYQARYYRKYYPRIKLEVFTYYSKGLLCCAECGAKDRLSIDHQNGYGDKHRLSLGFDSSCQFYLWLRRNNFPDGYRILCIHCNGKHRPTKGTKFQPTSKIVKRGMQLGLSRAKDIADWGQSDHLTRRAIFEAIRRLHQKGQIRRIDKGVYKLA